MRDRRFYENTPSKPTETSHTHRGNAEHDVLYSKAVSDQNLMTTHTFPGREIDEPLGIVSAECVLGINVFRDLLGGIRDIVGGRSGTHQKALKEAKETCLKELATSASALGADAVVGVDMDYSEISGGGKGMLLLVATGTAVRLR